MVYRFMYLAYEQNKLDIRYYFYLASNRGKTLSPTGFTLKRAFKAYLYALMHIVIPFLEIYV